MNSNRSSNFFDCRCQCPYGCRAATRQSSAVPFLDSKEIVAVPDLLGDVAVQIAPLYDASGFKLLVRLNGSPLDLAKATKPGFFLLILSAAPMSPRRLSACSGIGGGQAKVEYPTLGR